MMASILLLLHKPFLLPGITDFLCFYFIGYRLSRKSHFTNTKSFNSSVTDNVWARMTRIDTDSSLSFNFTYGHVISLTRRHSVIGMQCIITSEICHMYRHKNMHMAQRSLGRLRFYHEVALLRCSHHPITKPHQLTPGKRVHANSLFVAIVGPRGVRVAVVHGVASVVESVATAWLHGRQESELYLMDVVEVSWWSCGC